MDERPLDSKLQKELPQVRRALLAWHRRHGLRAPWRASGDAYYVLVAAVMAQQTRMSSVLPKFDEFISAFPTVEALAQASTGDLLRIWAPLGYNMRALRLHRAARRTVEEGGFARTAAELVQIEGIGPFTAAIISSFAFGEPAAAVDTNVRRVITRLNSDEPDGHMPERAVEAAADALMSRRAAARWNQAMMDLGGRVCTSRSPRCDACPLARWCRARPSLEADQAGSLARAAERRGTYEAKRPFRQSRRYYRGRIVQALRELPAGASLTRKELLERLPERDGLGGTGMRGLVDSLERDGLVRVLRGGRVRLP